MTGQQIEIISPSAQTLEFSVPKDISFDDWRAIGVQLAGNQRVLNWWIGDWWAAGQHRYGERAKLAAEGIFGREFQTLANTASVCRSFESSRRRESLSFTHHVEVAALPPDHADTLLDRAQSENWSTRELRREVIRHRVQTGQITVIPNDDPVHTETLRIAQAWNRASTDARREFLELAYEAALGEIDP